MPVMVHPPGYEEITECLGAAGDPKAAAEAHGTLCGLMCTAAEDLPRAWIQNTLADASQIPADTAGDAERKLRNLFVSSRNALQGTDMEFTPLLPEDRMPLDERTAALASWCQGFLYGLAVRGLRDISQLEGEIREFLEDLTQITRAEAGERDGPSEAEEAAYAELVEYVRIGVQLVFEETGRSASDN